MHVDVTREPLGTDRDGQAGRTSRHLAEFGGDRRR
jgi:hypothetical protein